MMDDKARIILGVFLLAGMVLLVKATQIQLISSKYREQAQKTTLSKTTLYPSRGLIYDRHGDLLLSNTKTFDLNAVYNNVSKSIDSTELCELLDIDAREFETRLNKDWRSARYHKSIPFVFMDKITPERYAVLQEHLYKYPGFTSTERNVRSYPNANAGHLLGFIGEVTPDDIAKDEAYAGGDYIGKSGLELQYEDVLRGAKGIKYDLRDNLGRKVSSYDGGSLDSQAVAGYDLLTGIDLDLQQYGEKLMQSKIGAVVAIEPSTGEILAMISSPSYDPELLNLNRDRSAAYDSLRLDTIHKPLFDRPTAAKYPPGSIFKTILSLIAMEKGILNPGRTIYCNGRYQVDSRGRYFQGCHHHPTPYNVSLAIQYSCNSYFYQTFREFIDSYGYRTPHIGLDTLNYYLDQFGLGKSLGIDYPIEDKGYVPTSEYYTKLYGNAWRSSYILSLGIGQGEYQFTTLQMANLAAIIGNRGWYITPHIATGIRDKNGDIENGTFETHKVGISDQHFTPVIEGMSKVAVDGTARLAYIPDIEICGKTGTSQNKGEDHSVFFAFAPKENPKIALAVFVENAGFGGSVAAPIASLMAERYIRDSISDGRKWLEKRMIETKLYEAATPAIDTTTNIE